MRIAVDAHKVIGTNAQGFAAQAKIHTRNNVGASGGQIAEIDTDPVGNYRSLFQSNVEEVAGHWRGQRARADRTY